LEATNYKAQSALEYLTTYGWAIIIISVVIAALFSLGLFNPGSLVNTSCIFPADFTCLSAVLTGSNGTLMVNIQQALPYNINVTAWGCNNQGTLTNMVKASPQNSLIIGANQTFSMTCYSNSSALDIQPGQIYSGYVLLNYTNLQTGFPHTVQGKLIAKAT
jgi:hypothetical protein